MALVSLGGPIAWPGLVPSVAGGFSTSSYANLTSAGHYIAYIYAASQDMVISHVGFRVATATGSPTADVRIETVDASGFPSGTLWGTNTNIVTGTLSANTNTLQALTASATITKGQVFCVKLAYASGTALAIGYMDVSLPKNLVMPYRVTNTGTPTKGLLNAETPILALGSSSTTFYCIPGAFPINGLTAGTFNNTNSARRGLRFTIPMNCRAVGIHWYNNGQIGDYNATLYNDAGTELSSSSTAYDGDYAVASSNGTSYVYFDNTVTLTAGTIYRISIEPTTATNCNVYAYSFLAPEYRSATAAGTGCLYTTFATGAWTDTATSNLPVMDLLIDQVDNGSGGAASGGGIIGA